MRESIFMNNRITELYNIRYPIVQGGMIWCSGWKLAAAVSNSGGLGLIGSGSMYPEVFTDHLNRLADATEHSYGVNIPLIYPHADEIVRIVLDKGVPFVFTSAGNPKKYTAQFKAEGIKVTHVVSNTTFALKAEEAGVDALVAEGFEAGGHNGREETTTLSLIPAIRKATDLPLIAAGGIAGGAQMLAAMIMGAEGVQIGSRFAASAESSAHINFKEKIVESGEGDTILTLKEVTPVRLIKNRFYRELEEAQKKGAGIDEITKLLGKGRARRGMFEGDLDEGELEIGQASSYITSILPVNQIIKEIVNDYNDSLHRLKNEIKSLS